MKRREHRTRRKSTESVDASVVLERKRLLTLINAVSIMDFNPKEKSRLVRVREVDTVGKGNADSWVLTAEDKRKAFELEPKFVNGGAMKLFFTEPEPEIDEDIMYIRADSLAFSSGNLLTELDMDVLRIALKRVGLP